QPPSLEKDSFAVSRASHQSLPLFSAWTVAEGWCSVILEVVGGPENAMSYEIKVARVFDGGVVVADGRAENTGLFWPVMVHARNNEIIRVLGAVFFENL